MLFKFFFRNWMTKKITRLLPVYFSLLNQIQLIVFSAYIKQDYFEYQLQYEKQLITKTKALFSWLKKMRGVANTKVDWECIRCCENLYESIFALELLKHRAIDHATFEVCRHEMQQVSQGLSLLLQGENKLEAQALLNEAINALENIFQTTIQFITVDPVIFLLFIRDIKNTNNEISHAMDMQCS